MISARRFQGRRHMESGEKFFDSFRNLVIILAVLCYTVIHSMSLRWYVVSEQFNYTKTRVFHAILLPVFIEFSRCIGTYASAKFEFMSDNPDTVYSYSGIYDTPVVFERDIKYSEDFSVTTVTYTMCVSHENGISSNLQKMKFYTNQLAPDKRSPGIVEGMTDVSSNGEHSITIWTPVVAATPFDYPSAVQDRYIGDAIELGYTIKTTGADDAIVHIVQ